MVRKLAIVVRIPQNVVGKLAIVVGFSENVVGISRIVVGNFKIVVGIQGLMVRMPALNISSCRTEEVNVAIAERPAYRTSPCRQIPSRGFRGARVPLP
jgi:hypothetical protein